MKLKIAQYVVVGVATAAGCAGVTQPPGMQVEAKLTTTTQRTVAYNYLLYWPKPASAAPNGDRYPLVIFLHGAGERGSDVNKVAANGPPKQAKEGRHFPFVMVSPQCPEGAWWDADSLQAFLDEFLARYGDNIDPDRIYLTGLSMGGGGSWDWISRSPNPFAAAVIVCGAASEVPIRIKDPIPVWAFHGTADNVVPPWITTMIADQWKQAGAEVRVTMYEAVNHGSWLQAYEEPELWDWLLSHRKQPPTQGRAQWFEPQITATQPVE